jgi:predicted ATP-binding protein involved in virulence
MRIQNVEVKNLRCIKEASTSLLPYTCFVGPNGAGKSTVLCALNIFFRNLEGAPTDIATLAAEDFHLNDTSKPIEITVTFVDLTPAAIADLSGYVRQGQLIVTAEATFDPNTGRAEVKQFGQRLAMKRFAPFFERFNDGALVAELIKIFEGIETDIPEIAALKVKRTKGEMHAALRSFEEANPQKCEPIKSADQFYGISGGKDRLSKYVQWIYIPAVKNASEEQLGTKQTSLGKLLSRTVNAQTNFAVALNSIAEDARSKYQEVLESNQQALDGISSSLRARLTQWSHPDATLRVIWENDSSSAVRIAPPVAGVLAGESGFEGKLARLGHGLQRSFLLALLQELASLDDKSGPTLILGCEEPELYQHPPQARHLASVFEKLTSEGAQIIVTTHSPYFISGDNFESVRMVRRIGDKRCASLKQFTYQQFADKYAAILGSHIPKNSAIVAKLQQALQPSLSEMFFTQALVLVEGLEDVAYIEAWLVITGRWEEYRRRGIHIVPVNGKSELLRPAIIAAGLEIPVLVLIDADGDKLMRPNKLTKVMEIVESIKQDAERDNRALIRLFGGDETNLFPSGVIWLKQLVIWPSDLADTAKREFVLALGTQGAEKWDSICNKARADAGNAGGLDKNTVYIGHLLSRVHEQGVTSSALDALCNKILTFADEWESGMPISPIPGTVTDLASNANFNLF